MIIIMQTTPSHPHPHSDVEDPGIELFPPAAGPRARARSPSPSRTPYLLRPLAALGTLLVRAVYGLAGVCMMLVLTGARVCGCYRPEEREMMEMGIESYQRRAHAGEGEAVEVDYRPAARCPGSSSTRRPRGLAHAHTHTHPHVHSRAHHAGKAAPGAQEEAKRAPRDAVAADSPWRLRLHDHDHHLGHQPSGAASPPSPAAAYAPYQASDRLRAQQRAGGGPDFSLFRDLSSPSYGRHDHSRERPPGPLSRVPSEGAPLLSPDSDAGPDAGPGSGLEGGDWGALDWCRRSYVGGVRAVERMGRSQLGSRGTLQP
jgi:hypothetical protein